jgi:hypothetical protein
VAGWLDVCGCARDRFHATAGRVHEEYKEITTRPIQKITGAIRSNPLFSKPPPIKGSPGDQELVPLIASSARSDPVHSAAPPGRTSLPTPSRTAVMSPEAAVRAGASTTGGSVPDHYTEFSPATGLDRNGSVSGDKDSEQPQTGSALAGLVGRGAGRGKAGATKRQSHVD